jgi:hypothetical protein
MPHDDLIELAQTGQLLESDDVREGPDGEWCAARDRPGLLDYIDPASPAVVPNDEPQASDMHSAPVEAAPDDSAADQDDATGSPQPDAIPVAQSLTEFDFESGQSTPTPVAPTSTQADPLPSNELNFEPHLPQPMPADCAVPESNPATETQETEPVPEQQTDELDFELNPPQPRPEESEESTPVASFTNLPELRMPSPRPGSQTRSLEVQAAQESETRPSPEPRTAAAVESQMSHAPTAVNYFEKATRVEADDTEPVARRRFPLPRISRAVRLIGAAALLLSFVWWLLPGSERDIYADYLTIYDELRERQSSPDGKAGWREFVNQSRARIDETNPWLEETAQPGDRAKNLLLYIGRDLQRMLEKSPDTASPHQQRLDGFFEQLAEIYESSR